MLNGILAEDWQCIRQIVLEVHNVGSRLGDICDLLNMHGFLPVIESLQHLPDVTLVCAQHVPEICEVSTVD